jgi:hypothetical protein
MQPGANVDAVVEPSIAATELDGEQPLTIPGAKRRRALWLGVAPSSTKITVEA